MWRLRLLSCSLLCVLALGGLSRLQADLWVIPTSAGTAWVLNTETGTVTAAKLASTDGQTPEPPPSPPEPGETLEQIAGKWRERVPEYPQREQDRALLRTLYSVLADQARSGSFESIDQLQQVTAQAIEKLLPTERRQRWNTWAVAVSSKLDALELASLDDAAGAFDSVASGLSDGSSEEALDPIWIQLIMQIIQLLLEQWGGG